MRASTKIVTAYLAGLVAGILAAGAIAASASSLPPEPDTEVLVLAHHCDGARGIDQLLIQTNGPAQRLVRWDNRGVCGDPA